MIFTHRKILFCYFFLGPLIIFQKITYLLEKGKIKWTQILTVSSAREEKRPKAQLCTTPSPAPRPQPRPGPGFLIPAWGESWPGSSQSSDQERRLSYFFAGTKPASTVGSLNPNSIFTSPFSLARHTGISGGDHGGR